MTKKDKGNKKGQAEKNCPLNKGHMVTLSMQACNKIMKCDGGSTNGLHNTSEINASN